MNLDIGDTRLIIEVCRARGISLQRVAYILATTWWETNKTMRPVIEAYWLSENWRKKNLRYYPYYGRGYVQLTWEENYIRAGKRLGHDFIKNPEKLLDPEIAARVLVIGMEEGWFTGKTIYQFIDDYDDEDIKEYNEYLKSRVVVNGTDKAAKIANLALEFEALLKADGYGKRVTKTNPNVVVKDEPKATESTPPDEGKSDAIWAILLRILLKLLGRF